jgi:hypothetical protein
MNSQSVLNQISQKFHNNQIIIDPNSQKSSDGNKIEITKCILKFLQ